MRSRGRHALRAAVLALAVCGPRPVIGTSNPLGTGTVKVTENVMSGYRLLDVVELPDADMTSASVTITSRYVPGEDVLVGCNQAAGKMNGVTVSWDAQAGTCALHKHKKGSTISEWREALLSLRFATTACDTRACMNEYDKSSDRTVQVVSSGPTKGDLLLYEIVVKVSPMNDEPMLSGLPAKALCTVKTPLSASAPIAPELLIVDNDLYEVPRARVTIKQHYEAGMDKLALLSSHQEKAAAAGITQHWNVTAGRLELQGTATKAEYQEALRSIAFVSLSDQRELQNRQILFQVDDGAYGLSDDNYWARTSQLVTKRDVAWNITVINGRSSEMGLSADLNVKLINEPTAPMLVSVTTSKASEGVAQTAFFVLTAGNWRQGIPVAVKGQNDKIIDGDANYNAIVSVMITQDTDYLKLLPSFVPLVNEDDPANNLHIRFAIDTVACSTSEEGATFAFKLELSNWWKGDGGASGGCSKRHKFFELKVKAATSNTAEGLLSLPSGAMQPQGEVVFTEEDYSQQKEFVVRGVDDMFRDGVVQYSISFTAELLRYDDCDTLASAHDLQPVQLPPALVCSNADNDQAGIVVTGCNADNNQTGATTETGLRCTFHVKLASQPYHDVDVDVWTDNTQEGQVLDEDRNGVSSGNFTLRIPVEQWNQPVDVVVGGMDDNQPEEPPLTPYKVLFNTRSDDPAYRDKGFVARMTNEDNDVKKINIQELCTGTAKCEEEPDATDA
eukprot:g6660.t1